MRLIILITIMLTGFIPQASESNSGPTSGAGMNDTKYLVTLTTNPSTVDALQPFTITLSISDATTNVPVTIFDEVHTKLLHLIIVSEDLSQFLHLHPDYQGNGVFTLKDVVLPETANYVVFSDFTPTGDTQQVIRNEMIVSGAKAAHAHLATTPTEFTVGELSIHLDSAASFKAGEETSLNFHVTNTNTGDTVNTLDEYLGAAGHLVIIDPSTEIYIHTHPSEHDMTEMSAMNDEATTTPEKSHHMEMPMQYGPHLEFMAVFPIEGIWAMWLQVQYQGEIYTFPYVVEVNGMAESTPAAHAHHG